LAAVAIALLTSVGREARNVEFAASEI
jgi:hypothetical protein